MGRTRDRFNRGGSALALMMCGLMTVAGTGHAQMNPDANPSANPLLTISDLDYQGAFRVTPRSSNDTSMNFAEGPIAYSTERDSVYLVGHSHHQAIVEFKVPELVRSSDILSLNRVEDKEQDFVRVLGRAPTGNPQDMNRIGALALINPGHGDTDQGDTDEGAKMIVSAYKYYDASTSATHTSLVLDSPDTLAGSAIEGYYGLDARAHAVGWTSPVPEEWQDTLGTTHIAGGSSGIPIIGRTSVGPSAFAFDPSAMIGNTDYTTPVPTETMLDFSLDNKLAEDLSNRSRENKMWTHQSRATYGFIAPGTRTYVTLGRSGGHETGVSYKITQDTGRLCGGYCTPVASDNYLFYWLWDMDDLLAVREGRAEPHSVRPYETGKFPTPFKTTNLGGGSFDPETGQLFVTLQRADTEAGRYSNPPIVAVYTLGGGNNAPAAPTNLAVE